ncbi:MAG: carbon storage regulator [Phycisphaerales bacterium]|nr:carbon storage regulator [Phycisphaerales bacterium]
MLVLSRQIDERIVIGDDIEIVIVDIRGDKVRLGIVAPTSISVHRKEVYEAIRKENEHAATLRGDVPMIHAPTQSLDSLKRLASGPTPNIKQFRRESA